MMHSMRRMTIMSNSESKFAVDFYINNGMRSSRYYYHTYSEALLNAIKYQEKIEQGHRIGASWTMITEYNSIEPLIAIEKDDTPLYRYDVVLVTNSGAKQEVLQSYFNASQAIHYANLITIDDLDRETYKNYKGRENEAWIKIDVSQWCDKEVDDTFIRWQYDRDLTIDASVANELLSNVQRHFNIIDEPILIDNAAVWIGNWVPSIKMLKKILPGAKKYIRILIGKYIVVDKDYVPELYYSSEVDPKIIIKDIKTYLDTGKSKYKAK